MHVRLKALYRSPCLAEKMETASLRSCEMRDLSCFTRVGLPLSDSWTICGS